MNSITSGVNNWHEYLKSVCLKNETLSEGEILYNIPYDMHNNWDNFMRGKTCPILENGDYGVYSCDLKQFLSTL